MGFWAIKATESVKQNVSKSVLAHKLHPLPK